MSDYQYCPRCATALVVQLRGGHERPVCPACGWVSWDNPTPVVAAVVERKGHVVLVQSIGWPAHFYGLVAGFLEKNESPEEAVLREVKEELGLDAQLGEFLGLYPFFRRNQLLICYHVEADQGEIELETAELAAYREVPLAKVRPWNAGTGYALADWLRSRGYEPEFVEVRR
jgi:NAD+ diphosphatase